MKCVRCTLNTTPLYGDLVYLLMNILGHQNKEACDSLNNVLNTHVVFKLYNNFVFNSELFTFYLFEW